MAFSYLHVESASKGRLFSKVEEVPKARVAVLLGMRKHYNGYVQSFYRERLNAAASLYHTGKVRGILVSGDNSRKDYNEPEVMKGDLIALGVPAEFVTLDYAGFRTLDTLIRAKEVFQQEDIILVSQAYHLKRGLFIARSKDINAYGFMAGEDDMRGHIKDQVREVLARVLAMGDIYVWNRGPKFLGKTELVALRSE